MAGHGGNHTPKPPDQRRRRNPDPVPWAAIEADGQLRGPELPGDGWHPRTLHWWQTWRASPQAKIFVETDWDFLLDTALIHHLLWSKNRVDLAAELRLRAGKLGATPEDRLRLRMSAGATEPAERAPEPAAPETAWASRDRMHVVAD